MAQEEFSKELQKTLDNFKETMKKVILDFKKEEIEEKSWEKRLDVKLSSINNGANYTCPQCKKDLKDWILKAEPETPTMIKTDDNYFPKGFKCYKEMFKENLVK